MSKKENFTMHPNLLKDVIFKQSGSILKAIEEAIQNSYDAGSKNIYITITNKGMIITDDGCGMTENEIIKHFKVFGNSSKIGDNNKIGQFGMGRGQIFAQGIVKWQTKNNIMITDCIHSLSYKLRKIKNNLNGTKITVLFYKIIDNYTLDRTTEGLKYYFLPVNINMYINGEKYEISREIVKEYSNKDFEVFLTEKYGKRIFSQELYVKPFDTLTEYNINCKNKMELNFARNSFLENDNNTKKLYDLISKIEKDDLLTRKKFDPTTGKKVISFILEGKLNIQDFVEKKIVERVDGKMISLKEIENKTIIFGGKNRQSDQALQQGHFVINDKFAYALQDLKNKGMVNYHKDSRTIDQIVKKGYYRQENVQSLYNNCGKKAVINWYLIQHLNYKVFDDDRYIYLGNSDTADGWTDGYHYICIHYKFCNYSTKNRLLSEIFTLLCHEYAHEEDDKEDMSHDENFYIKFYDLTNNLMNKFIKFMNEVSLNEIYETYEDEIYDAIKFGLELKKRDKKENLGNTATKILNSLYTLNTNKNYAVSTKEVQEQCEIDDTYVSEVLCKLERKDIVQKLSRNELSYTPKDTRTRSFWKITEYGIDILNKNL